MKTEPVRFPVVVGGITPTGPWNLCAVANGFLFVAGMRGIDPASNELVADRSGRARQAFENMRVIAESQGCHLQDAVRLTVYVTDMARDRPLVNAVQEALWPDPARYPPRTIVQVSALNQDDWLEVEGTFRLPD